MIQELDQQIRDARLRTFQGRATELAALRDAAGAFTVAYVHGPAGIGKSTLLHRFGAEAGRPVVTVRPGGEAPADLPREASVVLVDDLDRTQQPAHWIRHVLLPALPAGSLVVVASRQPPPVDWYTDPGWSDLLLPLPLAPFTGAESDLLLRAHGVPGTRREAVARVCGGNPLALRIAARLVTTGAARDEDLGRELALALSSRLVGAYPSVAHREALEVCALAATTNETLVRAMLPGADTDALFAWLRRLPFVTAGPRGLSPSDVVRQVVEADLRWRDPDRFTDLNDRLVGLLIGRARSAAGDAVPPAVADVLFAQRSDRTVLPGSADLGAAGLRERPYRPEDRAELVELARRVQGAGTARLVEFWLDRQPAGFQVLRRRNDSRIVAFVGQWDLVRPTAEELREDPVVAAAWNHVRRHGEPRSGELLNLVRFLVDDACPARPSDVTALLQARVATPLIRDDRIAWSVVVCPDADHWPARLARTHTGAGPRPVVVGERPYPIVAARRGGHGDTAQARVATWERADFEQEVRQTLRSWRRPDQFADSGLLRSRMVAEAGHDDAVTGLRQLLTAALDTLAGDPRQAKYHRVVVTTYLNGAPTQEAAAERLDLPFSTYRRHLNRGLDELCTLLWKVENTGLRLLTGASTAPAGAFSTD